MNILGAKKGVFSLKVLLIFNRECMILDKRIKLLNSQEKAA